MPHFVRDGGAWKEVKKRWVRDAGAWKEVKAAWVRDAGAWKQYFVSLVVTLASDGTYGSTGINLFNGPASAGLGVKRDGNVERGSSGDSTTPVYANVGGDPNEWAEPPSATVGDDYHVRFLRTSGSLSVGTDDTWLALTSNRNIEVNVSTAASLSWEGKVQLSKDGGSTILAESGVFTLTATSTTISF